MFTFYESADYNNSNQLCGISFFPVTSSLVCFGVTGCANHVPIQPDHVISCFPYLFIHSIAKTLSPKRHERHEP